MAAASILTQEHNHVPSYCDCCYKSLSASKNPSGRGNMFASSHLFDDYNTSSIARDDVTYRALPDLDDMLSHPMPTRTLRSVTPPPIFTSMTSKGGLSENVFSSSSTLTSNRYPYNSTMSELFDDLVSQRSRASQNDFENSRFRESRSLPPEDHPRVVSTTLPTYPTMYSTARKSYRQPKTHYEKIKTRPNYLHENRRTLEDLVDPQLLTKFGGSMQVPLQGITGRRPKSAYEFLPPSVPRRKGDNFTYPAYQTSYTPYVPYRNVYQPPSYWEAYNRPFKQYRYITDPKPYHTVRELEMDRIDRGKQLEKFRNRISKIPLTDYTASLKGQPTSNGDMDYGRKKDEYKEDRDKKSYSAYDKIQQPTHYDIVDAASNEVDTSLKTGKCSSSYSPPIATKGSGEDLPTHKEEIDMDKCHKTNGHEPVMEKLLSSSVQNDTEEKNCRIEKNHTEIQNGQPNLAEESTENIEEHVDENQTLEGKDVQQMEASNDNSQNGNDVDMRNVEPEETPVLTDNETEKIAKEEDIEEEIKMIVEDEPTKEKEVEISIENNTHEAEHEAGGFLRKAVDGLPIDLEATLKEEPMITQKDNIITETKPVEPTVECDSVEANENNEDNTSIDDGTSTLETPAETDVPVPEDKVTENEDDTTKANEVIDTNSNDIDAEIAEESEGEKLNPAASISSLVIEEVTITVPQMETIDVDGGNALATYTLVDGNTGQKLVDEKDIGNNESIRTEYDIEEVNVDCEE